MHHPFGKEEAASQKQLLGFFCECLRRGEWELAKACVPQLHEAQGDIPKKVEDILWALVLCPNQLRCGQDISPQRLAWVWLLVLEKWLALEKIFDNGLAKRNDKKGQQEREEREAKLKNNQPQGDSELAVVSDLKETSSTKISKVSSKRKGEKKCTKDLFSTHMEFVKPDELSPHRAYLLTLC